MAYTIDQEIALLKQQRDNILDKLAADDLLPSDNFEGQMIDRVGWRAGLWRQLQDINTRLTQLEPFEDTQVAM